MSAEHTRDPHTVPEPPRRAEPETAPHAPAPDGTVVQHGVPAILRDVGWPEVPGYEITGKIAEGGMGAVYAARDLTLDREVAVKTVLPKLAADPRFAAEFAREARLTARLPHPGIPPVHALGRLADGRPFLAMKLIRGDTLAARLAARPDPAGLVAVFEAVCQAVGFAHAQGVVHRDLKPGNVMVGAFGEVQVMDWGLAKVLSEPERERRGAAAPGSAGEVGATVAGQAKGTPAYMAPEQARGDWDHVDARADVFALGGILCAILTGEPPYGKGTVGEVMRRAATGDVSAAVARLAGCGADAELVGLCRRCLSAAPADRPADGRAVAGAVAAYRAGVEERLRATERDRAAAEAEAREQRKRRRVQLALAAAVGLLLAAGGGFAWWAGREEAVRRAEEQGRVERNEQALADLLGRCEQALRADDASTAEVGSAALPEVERRVAQPGGEGFRARLDRCRADFAVLAALDRVDDRYWALVEEKSDARSAAAAGAAEGFRRFGVVPGTTPPDEAARRVNESLVRDRLLGALDRWLGWEPEQAAGLEAILRAADPDEYRGAVRAAVRAKDAGKVVLWHLANNPAADDQPARFAAVLGERRLIPPARRGKILRAALRRRPADLTVLMALGRLYSYEQKDGADEPVRWFQAAVAARPGSAAAWSNLGRALAAKGEPGEAAAAYREAVRLDPTLAPAHTGLGNALEGAGDPDGAAAAHREAVRLAPGDALAHYNLGAALYRRKDYGGAIGAYRDAVRLDPTLVPAHYNLGNALRATGDVVGAAAAFRETVRLDPRHAKAHNTLAGVHHQQKKYADAVAAARAAIAADPKFADAHAQLGAALQQAGDLAGARAALTEAARLDPKRYGPLLAKLPPVPVAPPPRPAER